MEKRAFTLAEVLITLVIIGVIAALTIPNLIAKHEKDETVTKLKKLYSTLAQAYSLSVLDNGPVEDWNVGKYTVEQNLNKFIIPYLKVEKVCNRDNITECTSFDRVTLKGQSSAYLSPTTTTSPAFAAFRLQDGTILWAYLTGGIIMAADINGDAKPNKLGRDTFWFVYSTRNIPADSTWSNKKFHVGKPGFYLWGENNPREDLTSTNFDNCSKKATSVIPGGHCGALIKLDGWQIKDDYPW